MLQAPTLPHTIVLEEGRRYRFSNAWLLSGPGLRDLTIEGNGATIEAVAPYAYPLGWPFSYGVRVDISDPSVPPVSLETTYFGGDPGPFVETCAQGATTLTLIDPDDASRLSLGRGVVYSDSIQAIGFPANPRLWEWVEITDISEPDGETGAVTVTLAEGTVYAHRDDHPLSFTPGNESIAWGPVRVRSLDGPDVYYPHRRRIEDVTLDASAQLFAIAEVMEISGLIAPRCGLVPTLCRQITIEDSEIGTAEESTGITLDKQLSEVVITGTTTRSINSGTGVQSLTITDCTIVAIEDDKAAGESGIRHRAYDAVITGNEISLPTVYGIGIFTGGYGTGESEIADNTIVAATAATAAHGYWQVPGLIAVTVEEVGAGGEIVWDGAGTQGRKDTDLIPGVWLWRQDGGNPGPIVGCRAGTGTKILLEHGLAEAVQIGQVYYAVNGAATPIDGGGNTFVAADDPDAPLPPYNAPFYTPPGGEASTEHAYDEGVVRWRLGKTASWQDVWDQCAGWVESIEVDVLAAATGGTAPKLVFRAQSAEVPALTTATLMTVDLAVEGARSVDAAGASLQTGDTADETKLGLFWPRLSAVGLDGTNDLAIDVDELPGVTITVNVRGLGVALPPEEPPIHAWEDGTDFDADEADEGFGLWDDQL